MIVKQIIRSGRFGVDDLRELQEIHPYFIEDMLGHYRLSRKELYERVVEGTFGIEEFLDSLNCFMDGEPKGCLKWKFLGKLIVNEFDKKLQKINVKK